jgi:alkaline phosphatase
MSEAGAVDRAEHANDTARMIEEQLASDNTVQAIIDWVNRADTSATWDNTLLIITADHDHVLYGPQSATVPFQPLKDNGPGVVPGNLWLGPNHGTGLVPLFAYGKGAEAVVALATKVDDTGVDLVNPDGGKSYHLGNGHYVEQPTLGIVLKATAPQLVN